MKSKFTIHQGFKRINEAADVLIPVDTYNVYTDIPFYDEQMNVKYPKDCRVCKLDECMSKNLQNVNIDDK